MVQEPAKAEGMTLDLIHFLEQIIVEKNQPKQTKTHPKITQKTPQTNNKAQQ